MKKKELARRALELFGGALHKIKYRELYIIGEGLCKRVAKKIGAVIPGKDFRPNLPLRLLEAKMLFRQAGFIEECAILNLIFQIIMADSIN